MAAVTAASARAELSAAEDEAEQLKKQLRDAQMEAAEARRAGEEVLSAVEAAMAPLMAELAEARRSSAASVVATSGGDQAAAALAIPANGDQSPRNSIPALGLEIQHLKLDISSFKRQVDQLQGEERQRSHELVRLRSEVDEASESLSYEQQRVRHYEACRQLGLEGGSWAGLGPSGIGRRTMEVRAEKKLRESAEKQTSRLIRNVTKLAGDTAAQQATIEQLSRRLKQVRHHLNQKDKQLTGAAATTSQLKIKLKGQRGGVDAEELDDLGRDPHAGGLHRSKRRPRQLSSSTGRLPQLSF